MNESQAMVFDDQYMMEQNVWAADARLLVRFYKKAVPNKSKSDDAGRPIFEEKTYIKIFVPGDKNTCIDTPITEEYQRRFRDRYERWLREQESGKIEGTPLEAVTWLTVSQVAEFKAMNCHTVEQLAELSDSYAHNFMEAAKGEAANTKLTAELTKRDEEIEALKAQMAELIKATQKQAAATAKG